MRFVRGAKRCLPKATSYWALAALCWAMWMAGAANARINLPTGFQAVTMSPTLSKPVGMAFTPDGRLFVAEQRGTVKVIQNGTVISTFIHIKGEVGLAEDRGLLGIALHPNFASKRWVYLLYTVDPVVGPPDEPGSTPTFARLTRYRGTLESNGNVANLNTRKVLVGKTPGQGFPACFASHTIADLHFAPDHTLLVSGGDGASYLEPDGGGLTPGCFGGGLFGPEQDIGSFRAQSFASLDGKILRINASTGAGVASNPFYSGDGTSIKSKVWVNGLRQPFRFALKPGGGGAGIPALFIGDVGRNAYEEINVAEGGENFGWPCLEGPEPLLEFEEMTPSSGGCQTMETPANPGAVTAPLVWWHHNDGELSNPPGLTGSTAIGGVFYTASAYPASYHNAYFFADFMHGWIKVLKVNAANELVSLSDFASDSAGPVAFAIDPITGDLCYISFFQNKVIRIHYATSNMMAWGGADGELSMPAGAPGDSQGSFIETANCGADVAPVWSAGDGKVDFDDFMLVIEAWGSGSADERVDADIASRSDLEADGLVDENDVLAVIEAWGPCG
ncbi:MAG: PQQ-dependent sugar dehydrogenase [Phycisphaerales bacterium]|nr:PQQ-dependent sugar dehydrogenase [Phycisphaerales bacterium]MCI0674366.1 PQQ-dependent sugar dehydrogenase [Phycisphaerales bacterium]